MDEAADSNHKAIKDLLLAIGEGNPKKMKDLANFVMRDVPFTRDRASIQLAVICYSLSKVFNKDYYRKDQMRWDEFVIDLKNDLRRALDDAGALDKVLSDVKRLDESVGRFVSQITDKALSKKASTLHAYGLSIGSAAKLTGASRWDVQREIGQTKINDETRTPVLLADRLKAAKRVFAGGEQQ